MFFGITELSSPGWARGITIYHYIQFVAEGHSYDRKVKMKPIHFGKRENLDADHIKSIRDYIQDSVAMANSARRRGQPCYIVFGVDNYWDFAENGILDQSTRMFPPQRYEHYRSSKENFEKLQMEFIARDFCRIAAEFIEPEPAIAYEFGWLTHKDRQYLIGYLEYYAISTPTPFRVKQHNDLLTVGLTLGECWTRRAESNYPVKGDAIDLLLSWKDSPFVPYGEWETHLLHTEDLVKKSETSVSYFQHPLKDLPQQIIKAHDSSSNIIVTNLLEELQVFVNEKTQSSNVLYILGYGGSGKSTLLRQLVRNLVHDVKNDLKVHQGYTKADQPNRPIPIFVDLKNYYPSNESIESYIVSHLQGVKFDKHEAFGKLLSDPDLRFIVVFDSLDELPQKEFEAARKQLEQFIRHHPSVRFVVASRPYSVEHTVRYGRIFLINSFTFAQINSRIGQSKIDEVIKHQLLTFIEEDTQLQILLSIPRMLDACIIGMTHSKEHIILGNIVKYVITTFLQHEKDILGHERYLRFQIELDQLAMQCWNDEQIRSTTFENFEFLTRFLQTGLIRESSKPTIIHFASPYIFQFLLASQLDRNTTLVNDILKNSQYDLKKHATVIRFLSNWTDRSLSEWELSSLISSTDDPINILMIYLERTNPNVSDASDVYLALGEASLYQSETDRVLMSGILRDFLNDTNDLIFEATISGLIDFPNLLELIPDKDLEGQFFSEVARDRRMKLWLLLSQKTPKSVVDWIRELAFSPDAHLNEEIVISLLESDELDWSSGYPPNLVSIFTPIVPTSIQLVVLRKWTHIPEQLKPDIEKLVIDDDDTELTDEVRRVLGLNKPAITLATDSEEQEDTDTYVSSSILQLYNKE